MSSLDIVLQLLRIAPGTRSAEELKRLKLLTSNIKFFQKLTEEHGNDICHTRLCSRMTLRSYEAGQYIFNFNDPGDFFCVILKGKVSVQVPENTNVNSLRRNTLINLRPEKRPSTFVVVASPDADAATERSAEHNELAEDLKVELPRRKNTIILNEVATLEAGSVFGELSLISGQPRVASVQCKDPTYCAVLSRQDYQELLGAYEQQKLNEKIAVLASLPLFKGWTQSYLKKQHFYFTEVTFHRHQTVFQQGRPANYLYIIKEGEFKTYMHQPIDSSRSSNLITRAQRVYKRLELVIKGAGELLADEELVREIDHTCSCECISQSGTLIMIKQSDMRFRVNHPETWKYLKSKYETEGKWLSGRVNMLENPTVTWEEPPAVSVDLTPTRRRKSVVKPKSTDITFDKALVHAPRPQTRSSSSVYSDLVLKKLRDASVKPLMPKMRSYTPAVHRRLPAKPPPNFFVKAKAAVSQKYKNRRKILNSSSFAM